MITNPVFWEREAILDTYEKFCSHFGMTYKYVLENLQCLNQIFLVIDILNKVQKCKICMTNTKPFFLENETNLETSRKLSPYIAASYKFVLKSFKSLNRIFCAMEY